MRSVSASTSENRSMTCAPRPRVAPGVSRHSNRDPSSRLRASRLPSDRSRFHRATRRAPRRRLVTHVDAADETGFDGHRDAPGRKQDLERAAAARGRTTREALPRAIRVCVDGRGAAPLHRLPTAGDDVRLEALLRGGGANRVGRGGRAGAFSRRHRRRQHERYRERRPRARQIGKALEGLVSRAGLRRARVCDSEGASRDSHRSNSVFPRAAQELTGAQSSSGTVERDRRATSPSRNVRRWCRRAAASIPLRPYRPP